MMTTQEIKEDLKNILKESRYEHTLGVEYTAACLAMRYDGDMEKAKLAGLLHDCAKNLTRQEKLDYCKSHNLEISQCEAENPELLHAKIGACLARERYGVDDSEILSAITWHTTGKPDMSLLDKIIYIADFMEPNRNQAKNLPDVRKLAFSNIDDCLIRILEDSITYLASRSFTVDPMTQTTYEYYKALRKDQ